jgi:hypothetical protein
MPHGSDLAAFKVPVAVAMLIVAYLQHMEVGASSWGRRLCLPWQCVTERQHGRTCRWATWVIEQLPRCLHWVPTHWGLQLGGAGGPADAGVPRGPQPPDVDLEVPCPLVCPVRRPHLHASTPAQLRRRHDASSARRRALSGAQRAIAASSCCVHHGALSTGEQQAAVAAHHAVALPRGDGQPIFTKRHLRRLVHLAEPDCLPAILQPS